MGEKGGRGILGCILLRFQFRHRLIWINLWRNRGNRYREAKWEIEGGLIWKTTRAGFRAFFVKVQLKLAGECKPIASYDRANLSEDI